MMTKILKLFLFLAITNSFHVKAQQFDATLYFLDGSKRIGKADMVSNEENKLAFIENGSKKKEKIKVDLLDKVEYINPKNNETVTAELKEYIYFFLSDKPKTNFCWMKKINSGEISTYVAFAFDGGVTRGYHYTVTPSSHEYFFFQYKNEKPQVIYINNSIPTLNKKQMLRRQIRNFFKDKCPELVNNFEEEKIVIKNNNPEALRLYYEKNCSKKN
jgi:predicted GTPase